MSKKNNPCQDDYTTQQNMFVPNIQEGNPNEPVDYFSGFNFSPRGQYSNANFQFSNDHDEDDYDFRNSHEMSPVMRPLKEQHTDQIRLKYINKNKKLAVGARQSFLQMPVHIADNYLRQSTYHGPIIIPFRHDDESRTNQKIGDLATIFSYWNTMLGSGILTLPWTFQHSGIILGIVICFTSYLVSLRTCILIHRVTLPGEDFYDTVKKYWGPSGYYLAVICTLIII